MEKGLCSSYTHELKSFFPVFPKSFQLTQQPVAGKHGLGTGATNFVFLTGHQTLGRRVVDKVLGCFNLFPVMLVFHIDVVPGLRTIMNGAVPVVLTGCVCYKVEQMVYFLLGIRDRTACNQYQDQNTSLHQAA